MDSIERLAKLLGPEWRVDFGGDLHNSHDRRYYPASTSNDLMAWLMVEYTIGLYPSSNKLWYVDEVMGGHSTPNEAVIAAVTAKLESEQ